MQQFWHVFIAYGLAWLLVFGWAVAIFRRLGQVTRRLEEAGIVEEEGGSGPGPAR